MFGADRRLKVLGTYPDMPLAEARRQAKLILNSPKIETSTVTFSEALKTFLETHAANLRPSSKRELSRILNKHFATEFGQKHIHTLKAGDVSRVLDKLLSTPSEAAHAFKDARTFFRWCVGRGYIPQSPCEGMKPPATYTPRERVLTDDEIKAVWKAATDYPFGVILRLLTLTGQRRGEITALRWSWLGDDTITLPASICKNWRTHTFPFSKMAKDIVDTLPRTNSPLLFPNLRDPMRAFNGFGKLKTKLDRKADVTDWTLHDIRRTVATNLAALGTPIHVTEKLLNHVSGTVSGVVAVYNRHTYMDEMRAAIEGWESKLARILEENP
jgi:integrase